jgi:ubiquinone/menaquinone biosynthesis C-methylase UbiE
MGLYQDRIVPWLIEAAMRTEELVAYRTRVVRGAQGRVLEVGVGSGLNLAHYGPGVERIVGLDPSRALLARAASRQAEAPAPVELLLGSAEAIALPDASVDSIVMTWTLCSIPDPQAAAREMRRVMRPGGTLHFVEHGASPDAGVARWQDRVTPLWRRFSGGCHLNRRIDALLAGGGLAIDRLDCGYLPHGPRIATYFYEGAARRG